MKLLGFLLLGWIACCSALANEQDANLDWVVDAGHANGGYWEASWPSVAGRTYFIVVSDDMINWTYCQYVNQGTGSMMYQPCDVGPSSERFFLKLRYTDEPTTDWQNADFDHDFLTNWAELYTHGTDPLNWDTDGDSMNDGREAQMSALDPLVYSNDAAQRELYLFSFDRDDDRIPDVIDPDIDGDGDWNWNDSDMDNDGKPNASDPDSDNDGTPDAYDEHDEGPNTETHELVTVTYKDTFEGEFAIWSDDPLFFNGQEPIPVFEEPSFDGQLSVSVMLRKGFRASASVVGAPFYIVNGNWYNRESSDKSKITVSLPLGTAFVPVIANEQNNNEAEVSNVDEGDDTANVDLGVSTLVNTRGDDLNIDIVAKRNAADTNIESVAWIDNHTSATDATPRMPQLEFSIPNLPSNLKLKARLEVDYTRPHVGHQAQDLVKVPADGSFRDVAGDEWEIHADADWTTAVTEGFFGGDAKVVYKITKADGTLEHPETTVLFRIAGQNPEDDRCKEFINNNATSQNGNNNGFMWFAYAIAKHESNLYGGEATYYPFTVVQPNQAKYNQFRALGGGQSGARVAGKEGIPLHVNAEGFGPGGIGMFQVTGNSTNSLAVIPREQLWNWQKNVTGGLDIIRHKRDYWETSGTEHTQGAWAWMNMPDLKSNGIPKGQRLQAKAYNNDTDLPVPSHTVQSITFEDGTDHVIEDAVTLKMYNGASAGHYCSWDDVSNPNKWKFNITNVGGKNYVEDILKELDPEAE